MDKLVIESPHVIWWNDMKFQKRLKICDELGVNGVFAGLSYPKLDWDARARIRKYYDKKED